jgi:uncharacterized repeat protein (TIGR01451 family)
MTPHNRLIGTATVLCALVAQILGASGATAAPAAAWQIKQGADPTVLTPGTTDVAQYHVLITNVGGKAASEVTVTDTVSAGATPVAGSPSMPPDAPVANFPARPGSGKPLFPCAMAGQTVTCEIKTRAALPGEQIDLFVPVSVAASPPPTVTNEVTVSSPGAPPASSTLDSRTGTEPAPFAFAEGPLGLSGSAFDEAGGTPAAGAHPFEVELSASVSTVEDGSGMSTSDPLRSVFLDIPAGLVANPLAVRERCTLAQLQEAVAETPITACPPSSQVGVVHFGILRGGGLENLTVPLIDMVPPPGVPAEFAFVLNGTIIHIQGGLASNLHVTAGARELLAKFPVAGVKVDLWGIPSDPRHDAQRGGAGIEARCGEEGGCGIEPSPAPFLTMPTSCSEAMELGATATGWLGSQTSGSTLLEDLEGHPVVPTGCNQLTFESTISSLATTNQGESPSGLDFSLHQPQEQSLEGRSTAALKDVTVTLPEGMSLNPSAAHGLAACTEEQMGYDPQIEPGKILFRTTPQSCPAAAKVGTVSAHTPLLDHPVPGSVYVAKPFDNPFGSLLAIYLAIEDEESGIVAKLAGRVTTDPTTGQLTTTFTENPELPLEDIELHLFAGVKGVLTTPLTCGPKTTTSTLTPWSTPEGAGAHPTSTFQTTAGCSGSEAAAPKAFSFTAGTVSPLAGAYSPFVLRLARPDGSQHITGLDTTLPEGLIGKLAGVPYCPESGIAQARSREHPEMGKLEQQSPSCPASSEVGTVTVTAGSGISPLPVSGHVYMAGPYKGAPLSVVVIVPGVAGPFDLGTVVDRVALDPGLYDTRIHAAADPFPTIREGIPLDVRTVELKLDRPSFTLNPTSCEVKAIEGAVTTQTGQTQPVNNRFQVGECRKLGFKPKIAISLKGGTGRAALPALKVTVTYPKGGSYANIARAQVSLPHSEFLEQNNIGQACTKPVLEAGRCPASSVYGKVKAFTSLLEKPLVGSLYLSGGYGYKLPALVAELNGQIRVLAVAKVDTGKNRGIRTTFESVPDAPLEKVVIELKGGKKYGLLINSENTCKKKQVANAAFTAQNGKKLTLHPVISNDCKGKGKKGGKGKSKGGKKKN